MKFLIFLFCLGVGLSASAAEILITIGASQIMSAQTQFQQSYVIRPQDMGKDLCSTPSCEVTVGVDYIVSIKDSTNRTFSWLLSYPGPDAEANFELEEGDSFEANSDKISEKARQVYVSAAAGTLRTLEMIQNGEPSYDGRQIVLKLLVDSENNEVKSVSYAYEGDASSASRGSRRK